MTRDEFLEKYRCILMQRVAAYSSKYAFKLDDAPAVAEKMVNAIERNSFTLERGTALWELCREIGIQKPSAKALSAWYKENVK